MEPDRPCLNCGAPQPNVAKFCGSCGNRVGSSSSGEPTGSLGEPPVELAATAGTDPPPPYRAGMPGPEGRSPERASMAPTQVGRPAESATGWRRSSASSRPDPTIPTGLRVVPPDAGARTVAPGAVAGARSRADGAPALQVATGPFETSRRPRPLAAVLWSAAGLLVVGATVIAVLYLLGGGGTKRTAVSRTHTHTTLPAIAPSAAAGSSGGGSSRTPQPSTPAAPTGVWSAPQQIDNTSSGNALNAVSCATPTFCVAVDSGGYVHVFSGGTWVSGQQVDPGGNTLQGVSCPTTTYCVAVDNSGNAFTDTAGTWSSGNQIDTASNDSLNAVSCPTATFCMAVDSSGTAFTDTAGTWSSGSQIDTNGNNSLNAVSCPTPTFCVAVDNDGYAFTYNNGSWANTVLSPPGPGDIALSSVSCTSPAFCVAVDVGGYAFTDRGGSWSTGSLITGGQPISSAGGGFGGTTNPGPQAVSCATPGLCQVVDGSGSAIELQNGSWQAPQAIDSGSQGAALLDVACVPAGTCIATDSNGNVLTYAPPSTGQASG